MVRYGAKREVYTAWDCVVASDWCNIIDFVLLCNSVPGDAMLWGEYHLRLSDWRSQHRAKRQGTRVLWDCLKVDMVAVRCSAEQVRKCRKDGLRSESGWCSMKERRSGSREFDTDEENQPGGSVFL